ncbi:MAG: hypothetical protein JXB48_00375, partial [Candidatus Latescibacteria bacterium]|nr:hypothetical protein [Candidatus Latescibacterota bacterium]
MHIPALAFRNFSRNLRRYKILVGAFTLVVGVLIILTGIVNGITDSLREKASRYFAGDIVIQHFDATRSSVIPDPEKIRIMLESLKLEIAGRSKRSVYYQNDAKIFFAGY